ncbi:MAG: MBL fold metallo-hydrolase [Planctomycetota bacterium]
MGVRLEYDEFGPVRRWRVSRTLLGRPLFFAAVFWLDGLVIDTGPTTAWEALEPEIAKLPVKAIVVTHHHEDHGGNAGRIAARFGCPVLSHPLGIPPLASEDWTLGWYRHFVWGVPGPSKAVPLGEEIATERYRLRVIHTPGHSDDHVVFHEPREGLLFTGDLFLHEKLKMMRNDEDAGVMAGSLASLLSLPSSRLFCCHNPRVPDDHREAIGAKLSRFRELRGRALEMRADGVSLDRIRDDLLGREEYIAWISRGRVSKRNLIEKLMAWQGA